MSKHARHIEETQRDWVIPLAFWVCLLAAFLLYSAVALAPKLSTYLELRSVYRTNRARMVALQRQIDYLNRVVHALETDPAFAAELARFDFNAVRPGDERIPVGGRLVLDARNPQPAVPAPREALPWYEPPVRLLARDGPLRKTAIVVACLITVLAFTFLHDSQAGPLQAASRGAHHWLGRLKTRYCLDDARTKTGTGG